MSGIDTAKVWRPLNADLFEMNIKKQQAQFHDAMTNRIGVLQNLNPSRFSSFEQSPSNEDRKKIRS